MVDIRGGRRVKSTWQSNPEDPILEGVKEIPQGRVGCRAVMSKDPVDVLALWLTGIERCKRRDERGRKRVVARVTYTKGKRAIRNFTWDVVDPSYSPTMTISLHTMPTSDPTARPPRLRRRWMSAPPLRAAPPRLPPCRPLPLSLEALDLSLASPAQALASLRFLVLRVADLEHRLSLFESAEWASTALDMLHSIRADVHSHLPDLPSLDLSPALSLDFDYFEFDEFKEKLKSRLSDVKGLVASLDFSSPLSYVSARLAAELPCFEFEFAIARPTFEFRRPSFDFDFGAPPLLRELLDVFRADVDAFFGGVAVPAVAPRVHLPTAPPPAGLALRRVPP
ncbi:hypothetical protein B0H13DRAFT_2273211 [Mycena leptocephala]|nr:hypothetical protein B0H13DRAFT_2273211 [Mycena leptocephala]